MRALSISRLASILAVTAIWLVSTGVNAECVRWKPERRPPNTPPTLDGGTGRRGALQNTLTLDCLTYVGSIQESGEERLLIRDERGKVHVLQIGHYMGENFGMITKIDADYIYVMQYINRNPYWNERDSPPFASWDIPPTYGEDRWEQVVVKFPKGPAAR